MQLCLYDENKKPIINNKYSIMKYIKDQGSVNQEELKNKMTLKAIFSFWKIKQKISEFKKRCGQRIRAKCVADRSNLKLKLIQWYKINKLEKVKYACRLIQKNYRIYRRKNKK